MTAAGSSSAGGDRTKVDVSVSVRTILLFTVAAAIVWALASIANVLLVILVSVFSVAVLSPVVTAMERRFGWSRGLCSTVLVLVIVLVVGVVALVLAPRKTVLLLSLPLARCRACGWYGALYGAFRFEKSPNPGFVRHQKAFAASGSIVGGPMRED